MEEILQTRNQIHEQPTCRTMQASNEIAKFVYATRHNIASPTMDLEKDKKSTNSCKEAKNLQNSPKWQYKSQTIEQREHPKVTQMTQIQHIAQGQRAITPYSQMTHMYNQFRTTPHTLQDHPPVASL